MSLRFQVMLALGLVAFIVFSAFIIPALAQQDDAVGQREAAFAKKADKLLREVRRASETDRVASEKGRVRDAESEVSRLSQVAGVRRLSDGRTSVGVNVELTSRSDEELKAAGFAVRARLGDVATVETEVERLPELAALGSVRKLSAATFLHPLNDRARFQVGIDNFLNQRVVSQTGHGVVVGIIDSGIDFRHQDFTVPGTGGRQTRVKALLDMTSYGTAQAGQPIPADPGWDYTLPGATATIGHLYTEADINTALQSAKPASQTSDVVKERDKNGHGTHVAGTAAGNGMSSPTPGTYAGMAPDADLVIVKASRQNDGTDNFGNDDIINALKFVQQKAAELGEPFVINLSLGGHGGSPHDGTDPDERAIDNLINGGAGRAVCVAAGNEGGSGIHASGNVPAGGDLALGLNAQSNPGSFTLYYANSDRFSMTIRLPNGTTVNSGTFNGEPVENTYLTIYNGTDDKQDSDPSNDQSSLFVVFKKGAENLGTNWTFTLHGTGVASDGHFNAWVDDGSFTSFADDSRLVGTPGTARGAITVGAYVTRSASLTLGSIAPFSSPGPTADGRQKPDITAPGYYLYSSRSTDVSGVFGTIGTGSNAPTDSTHYTGLLGTSMATPVVTGSVALMLQANAGLTGEQIKDSIKASADSPTGGTWDAHFGFGKLNVPGAIALGGKTAYSISGHVNVVGGDVGWVNAKLTGPQQQVAFSSLDSNGNYSFKKLAAGGNYTVTPYSIYGDPYTYSPTSQTFNNLSSNQTADFTATLTTYSISGRVTDTSGAALANLQVFLGFQKTTLTDANGYYSFPGLKAGQSYQVNISNPDYYFPQGGVSFASLSKDEVVNYTGTRFYSVSGRITDDRGAGLDGVSFTVSSPFTPDTKTDSNGYYTLKSILNGSSVTIWFNAPQGYKINPASVTIANMSGNQTLNVTATRIFLLYGKVLNANGQGVNGVTMTASGSQAATVMTNNNGEYFLYLPRDGTYTITPSVTGFGFNPASQTFSNLNADTTAPGFAPIIVNPIDDSQNFVTWHYRDFLGRDPDADGLGYWSGELGKCGTDPACLSTRRGGVSAAFFIENEFQLTGSFVYRLYKGALGRQLTYTEFTTDRPLVAGNSADLNASKAAFADAFVQRAEFTQKYLGQTGADSFVDALIANVKASSGTDLSSQRATLISTYNTGGTMDQSRSLTVRAAIEDAGFKQAVYNPSFVLMQYFGYLHRNPEQGGYDFWLNVLNNKEPGNYRGMVCSFITSAEYQLRFGQTVTRTNRDCK
ncbi:MAG TPA: S8 family serine peptidase [Pyrinomonadaceae bacterium]|nr:S8 family serine peptidase [Pyrinomonadaceae bacterium]